MPAGVIFLRRAKKEEGGGVVNTAKLNTTQRSPERALLGSINPHLGAVGGILGPNFVLFNLAT